MASTKVIQQSDGLDGVYNGGSVEGPVMEMAPFQDAGVGEATGVGYHSSDMRSGNDGGDGGGGGNGSAGGENDEDAQLWGQDDEGQDPATIIREFGAHPIMDRVQQALYDQLVQTYERVSEELRDKENELKRYKNKRETVGVELYSMQQQLARLQVNLEQTHNIFNEKAETRAKSELDLDQVRQLFATKKQELEDITRVHKKNRSELNALQETLRQVEQYNEEMKSEILVTRRATYKAEASVQGMEKEKGRQDFFIDGLMEQVKRLQEEIVLRDARIGVQQENTEEAEEMTRQANKEMELIQFEKKQLLQQWRSALIGLAKREEVLAAANKALREAEGAARDYDTELQGVKREILKAQAENETLVAIRDRLESETHFAEEQLEKIKGERDILAERYNMLSRSQAQMEEDERKADTVGQQLQLQVATAVQNISIVTRERQKLEKDAAAFRNLQAAAGKATNSYAKQAQQVLAQTHEKEIEEANLQNELARVRVDSLNTEAHNSQLRDTLQQLNDELNSRDRLIAKYQLEIRQRNDEIEKKMYRVDRLNRKYEKLMEAHNLNEPESSGPLEASIKNLNKEIDAIRKDNSRLKHEWLQDQTQLVGTKTGTEEILEINNELRARASILGVRKARMLREGAANEAEGKRLAANMQTMHLDMARLSQLIGKNGKQAAELANSTSILEREFVQELKELERESFTIEEKIANTKSAKNELLADIIETERQVMLWDKKIQLEKETQAALDPDMGKGEVKGMEREIHRMRIRLETLKREQELMIQEMERAIMKREQIAVRYKGKAAASANKPGVKELTQTNMKKRIELARKDISKCAKETQNVTAAVEDKRYKLEELTQALADSTLRYEELSKEREALQTGINTGLHDKQMRAEMTAMRNKMLKRLHDLSRGVIQPPDKKDGMRIEQALMTSENKLEGTRTIITDLQNKYEHLSEVLGQVLKLAQDATTQ